MIPALIIAGFIVFALGFLWPAQSRRWGGDEVPQSARQYDEWDVGPRALPAPQPATYWVGDPEVIDAPAVLQIEEAA